MIQNSRFSFLRGEEGGDDARSECSFDVLGYTHGTMARTMGCEVARRSQSHQSAPQFGLESVTRLHEVGIASKRKSARCVEYVLESCTHRPSRQESREAVECRLVRHEPRFGDRDEVV